MTVEYLDILGAFTVGFVLLLFAAGGYFYRNHDRRLVKLENNHAEVCSRLTGVEVECKHAAKAVDDLTDKTGELVGLILKHFEKGK